MKAARPGTSVEKNSSLVPIAVAKSQPIEYDCGMSDVLDAITAAIKASGRTPASIAKEAGIHKSQLSRMLAGEQGLRIESVEKLAKVLRLRITIEPKSKSRER
jgi:DNA-binding phage protein